MIASAFEQNAFNSQSILDFKESPAWHVQIRLDDNLNIDLP